MCYDITPPKSTYTHKINNNIIKQNFKKKNHLWATEGRLWRLCHPPQDTRVTSLLKCMYTRLGTSQEC